MPRITLSVEEGKPGVLPNVCMACGAGTGLRVPVNFSWVPAWSYVLLVAGIWPWAVFYLILRLAMVIEVPVCGRHRRHWMWRKWLLPAGLLATLVLLVVPALADPDASGGPPTWALFGSFGTFAVTITAAIWLRAIGIRAVAISREMVTLTGIAPEFVEAVEAGRVDYQRREQEWLRRFDQAPDRG